MTSAEASPPAGSAAASRMPRIVLLDAARGAALAAMAVYHFAWDLSFYRLIATDVVAAPGWRWFAHLIAGSFLFIVGASLALATRESLDRPAFLWRLAKIAGAAGLVTAATVLALPDHYIFFGILHHIALASVLALPFVKAPAAVTALAAAAAFALPALVAHPLLDRPMAAFLGLGRASPDTADLVPVFPWFGCVLAGLAAARLVLARGRAPWMAWRPQSRPGRLLVLAGRHSLLIYLAHQPILIGLILAFLAVAPAAPTASSDPEARPFVASCVQRCTAGGRDADDCQAACLCTAEGLRREGLWRQALSGALSSADQGRVAEVARACVRAE